MATAKKKTAKKNAKAKPVQEAAPVVNLSDLIAQAEYQQHPYGQVWQPFDAELFKELVANVNQRGLGNRIILYQGMILDGWHRYLACLATKTKPVFHEFNGTDLEAAELVHASGLRRNSSADQRYASFTLLCDACPAFKAKYERLQQVGMAHKREGKPLSTDGQTVDVLKTKAQAASVSKSTAQKVEEVKRLDPEKVRDIAEGKTSANKALKELKGTDEPKAKRIHKYNFAAGVGISGRIDDLGQFEIHFDDSNGVAIMSLPREAVDALYSLLRKVRTEDDKCEPDEIPDE